MCVQFLYVIFFGERNFQVNGPKRKSHWTAIGLYVVLIMSDISKM